MIEITDLSHVTLVVRDQEASRAFYAGMLGMEEVRRPAGFDPRIRWYRRGGAEVHLIALDAASQEPGDHAAHPDAERDLGRARHLAFAVGDLDATLRALEERGVPVLLGPRPRGDGPVQLYIRDPDGHLVELHTVPAA